MDLLKNMNQAMAYIEEHLTDSIDFQTVAKLSYCSEYHFKRMFSFLAGGFAVRIHPPQAAYPCSV